MWQGKAACTRTSSSSSSPSSLILLFISSSLLSFLSSPLLSSHRLYCIFTILSIYLYIYSLFEHLHSSSSHLCPFAFAFAFATPKPRYTTQSKAVLVSWCLRNRSKGAESTRPAESVCFLWSGESGSLCHPVGNSKVNIWVRGLEGLDGLTTSADYWG